MRVVVQRVGEASVSIGGSVHASIGRGMMVLAGIEKGDTEAELAWVAAKVAALRIFDDGDGVMNLDVRQADGEILLVSQFTLQASTRKGNRPSYIRAAGEAEAVPLFEAFRRMLSESAGREVPTGVFGADMQVALVNDGPVTIIIDSRLRNCLKISFIIC